MRHYRIKIARNFQIRRLDKRVDILALKFLCLTVLKSHKYDIKNLNYE